MTDNKQNKKIKSFSISNRFSEYNNKTSIYQISFFIKNIIDLIHNNPYSKTKITNITLSIKTTPEFDYLKLIALKPQKKIYAPGQNVQLQATFQRFRKSNITKNIVFPLQNSLSEGTHNLVVSSGELRWWAGYSFFVEGADGNNLNNMIDFLVKRPSQNVLSVWMIEEESSLIVAGNRYYRLPANKKKLLWNSLQTRKNFFRDIVYKDIPQKNVVRGILSIAIQVKIN
jgi:hypothetical protein